MVCACDAVMEVSFFGGREDGCVWEVRTCVERRGVVGCVVLFCVCFRASRCMKNLYVQSYCL